MAEITVKLRTEPQCEGRPEGFTHCWHTLTPAFQNGPQSAVVNALCCHCAPSYHRQTVLVPWNTPVEEMVAIEAQHGPLVSIMRMEKPKLPGPQLLIPADAMKH